MGTIVVANLGKAYKQYPTRWARLLEWLDPLNRPRHRLHWVLRDINFTIASGEAVGIVGANGAGKSTLLKIIVGITHPTTGHVYVDGQIAALLELGMGFHPDFTGRQNVFMAGQLLGLSNEEIASLMPEIEAFAEIGDYIDQPLRVYSSGMQMRLAFAVAIARRPEVLIIDEALSVGDAAFQRKCFQRIESYRASGSTLLFVSHDIETIKRICDRAIFIKDGKLENFGEAKLVCDEYERYLFGMQGDSSDKANPSSPALDSPLFDPTLTTDCETIYGNGKAEIVACWLEDEYGRRINVIEAGRPFRWRYRVHFNQDIDCPIFAMTLKTREGVVLYSVDSSGFEQSGANAGEERDVTFELINVLAPGIYFLNCGVYINTPNGVEILFRRVDSGVLRVTSSASSTAIGGLIEMNAKLYITSCQSDENRNEGIVAQYANL